MTIDEAIKSYREIAEKSRKIGKSLFDKLNDEIGADWYEHQAEEYDQLSDWLEELKAYRETDAKTYICDVEKNIDCSKTFCHINGGECRRTTHKEFALSHDNEDIDMREEANDNDTTN